MRIYLPILSCRRKKKYYPIHVRKGFEGGSYDLRKKPEGENTYEDVEIA